MSNTDSDGKIALMPIVLLGGMGAMVVGSAAYGRYAMSHLPRIELKDDFTKSIQCEKGQPKIWTTKDRSDRPIEISIRCSL